ncbi:unnamed protein product, partial [Allacma fusca]
MKIRKELVAEEEHEIFIEEEADEIVEISVKPKRILIASNVVENQFYNNHHVPLLAETNINFTNKAEVEVPFQPVAYVPLNCEHVNQIYVTFIDENLIPIRLQE